MAVLKAFKGVRPTENKAKEVASRPYDVLNCAEARKEAKSKPYSFLHVIKPEIDLPDDIDPYAKEVYIKGKENFQKMLDDGVIRQDQRNQLYIYQLTMDGKTQTGIVGCCSIDDYFNNVIKKHELTRPDKEEDRKNHVRVGQMHAEPVFFSYRAQEEVDKIVNSITKSAPEYNVTAEDDIHHKLWAIVNEDTIEKLVELFANIESIYVADGHHRTAAAALVGKELREANPNHNGNEPYNFFMAVLFPDNQLNIIDYNRVVKDLNGLNKTEFLNKLSSSFDITNQAGKTFKPAKLHEFGMYLDGEWYELQAKAGMYNDADVIDVLDVTVLSNHILDPILNIKDLRTDKRIDFVGGIRGLGELKKRVDSGEMAVAFALYPVSMKQLINISDSGKIMPPKTTWFEPKLRSGLFVHLLN